MILEKEKITENIQSSQPFSFSFKYADKKKIMFLNAVIAKVLTKTDQLYLLNYIITIIREIIENAQKANAKRIFFKNRKLDMNDAEQYSTGMDDFKQEIMSNTEAYKQFLENNNLTVDILFSFAEESVKISVINSIAISLKESERIQTRIEAAKKYDNIMERFQDIADPSEGAGLGIALIIVTLKNLGIDLSSFSVNSDEKKTTVSISIPSMLKPVAIQTVMKKNILSEIDGLPTFPERVLRLMEMCDNPDSSLSRIADEIMIDPAMTAEILKLSNSAGFISGRRIEKIQEAIKIIGLKNIKAMLIVFQTRKIMEETFSKYEALWDHCMEAAFYGRMMGNHFYGVEVSDKAYLAGLLHDMGKIILLSVNKDLVHKISKYIQTGRILSTSFLEEVSIGISHGEIGALLADKWGFPKYLIDAIRHHHDPLSVSEEHYAVVETVYMANMFCGIRENNYNYYFFYEEILEEHNMSREIAFQSFYDNLVAEYKSNKPI